MTTDFHLVGYSMSHTARLVRGHRGRWMRFILRWRNRLLPQFFFMEF